MTLLLLSPLEALLPTRLVFILLRSAALYTLTLTLEKHWSDTCTLSLYTIHRSIEWVADQDSRGGARAVVPGYGFRCSSAPMEASLVLLHGRDIITNVTSQQIQLVQTDNRID